MMLDTLADIALEAGRAILVRYEAAACAVRAKADGSPVTEADAEAEAIILAALRVRFPDIPAISEEACAVGAAPSTGPSFFLVDPLDGTKEFLNRNGEFTVNIALIEAGSPKAGVVSAPALGRIYAGEVGSGARMAEIEDGREARWRAIAARTPPAAGLDVVASRSHMTAETEAFLSRFPIAHMVSAGSSLKFCRIAAGEADLYPRLGRTMEWDTAAGDAVLRAAGGGVFDLAGAPLRYGKIDQPQDAAFANPWFVAAGRFDPFTFAPTAERLA